MTTPLNDLIVAIEIWGSGANSTDFQSPADLGFAEADGWPASYSIPGSGDEPPRELFNWDARRLTAFVVQVLTSGGGLPWDRRISYLHPAVVMGSDGMLYASVQDSMNQNPTTDSSNTYWQQVGITLNDADIKAAYERNANTNALTDALLTALNGAAPRNNPSLTGAVIVPDQTGGTNNGRAANTRFVQAAIAALVASAPGTLNTLNELADALGDDPNFATTIMNMITQATTIALGRVELSTSSEVRNAIGSNPGAAIEDNVVTLQGVFDLIKVYEDGNLPNTVPADGTIELVYES